MKVVEVVAEEYYTKEEDYMTVVGPEGYKRAVEQAGYMKAVEVLGGCMKVWGLGDCKKAGEQVHCMKAEVLERYRMAQEGHMMAGYLLGDYMRVEDQEDYRWMVVELMESCRLVVVQDCHMKVEERVGHTWVVVQVFHTYLAHCTTALVLEDYTMPQVQAGCKKIRRHSICPR